MTKADATPRWRLPEEWRPDHPVFAFHEDSNANAVLITREGEVYAVAEERLTRRRFQTGFPARSLAWIEEASGVRMADVPVLVFGNRTHFLPRVFGAAIPTFEHDLFGLSHKLMLAFHHLCYLSPAFTAAVALFNQAVLRWRHGKRVVLVDHHAAHAASAYYTSGKDAACAVSADNFGDGYAAKVFDCAGPEVRFLHGASALNSPGQFYGEIAQLAGIHPLLAGKLTGMAASGDPAAAAAEMRALFDATPDGRDFTRTFGWTRSLRRGPFPRLGEVAKYDLAASAQWRFEEALLAYVRAAVGETRRAHVVLAGGSFANVRLNQKVLELPGVESVWIHPAMSDQGIAMGAALAYIASRRRPARAFEMDGVLLGPEPGEDEVRAALGEFGLPYERPDDLPATVARLLVDGKVVARFAGPLEYGPRALGNRSILYHAKDATVQGWLNAKLHRASYMPFAPVAMEEHAALCFEGLSGAVRAGRFMTISLYATDWMKANCPGVVHKDGTVRPQLLRREDNPGMHAILAEYHRRTGLPCVINTSFNMHEEPIVATARDACRAFRIAGLDHLIAGPYLVRQA